MFDNINYLSKDMFQKRTNAGLDWLKTSIDQCNGAGSAAYYSRLYKPLRGWSSAYPETTGYIIETLFDYYHLNGDTSLNDYAIKCAEWICGLQMQNGALPAGLHSANPSYPSVFNTGQMIFGLVRTFEETQDERFKDVFEQAVNWLLSSLEKDGSWQVGSYKSNYIPSYYTRVVWSVLMASKYLSIDNLEERMRAALQFYSNKILDNQSVEDWSFQKGQPAFTHTIAYTIRGFLESALLLEDEEMMEIVVNLSEKILTLRELKGALAGWYSQDWKGNYKFICLTGNCQLSIILSKLYRLKNDIRYQNVALKIFGDIVFKQKLSGSKNTRGAIAGSYPVWGRYLFMRYPNWATKFFLDAYYVLNENHEYSKAKYLK